MTDLTILKILFFSYRQFSCYVHNSGIGRSQLRNWTSEDERAFASGSNAPGVKVYIAFQRNLSRMFGDEGRIIKAIKSKYQPYGISIVNHYRKRVFIVKGNIEFF